LLLSKKQCFSVRRKSSLAFWVRPVIIRIHSEWYQSGHWPHLVDIAGVMWNLKAQKAELEWDCWTQPPVRVLRNDVGWAAEMLPSGVKSFGTYHKSSNWSRHHSQTPQLLLVAHNANMIHCLSVLLFAVRMQMEYWYPSMLSYSMFSLTPSSNRDPASIIETRLLFEQSSHTTLPAFNWRPSLYLRPSFY